MIISSGGHVLITLLIQILVILTKQNLMNCTQKPYMKHKENPVCTWLSDEIGDTHKLFKIQNQKLMSCEFRNDWHYLSIYIQQT